MLAMAPIATSSTSSTLPTGRGQSHAYQPFDVSPISSPRQLKSHKPLPRPTVDPLYESQPRMRTPETKDALPDSTSSVASTVTASSQSSSPRTLKHKSQRLGTRPDLPPTPPTQSRTSSGSHSAVQPTPAAVESIRQLSQPKSRRPPITPPDQKSPPTPDVTPPQPVTAIKTLKPSAGERSVAGTTPTASRTESFTTAREEQLSSEDEMAKASVRRYWDSGHTSQTTILRVSETVDHRTVPPQALDQALNRLDQGVEGAYTPRTTREFDRFDGQWTSVNEWQRDQKREDAQDTRHSQIVTSRKKRHEPQPSRSSVPPAANSTRDVVEHYTVVPTAAARAARTMQVKDTVVLDPSPISSSRPSISDTSASVDARRSSGTSTHSSISPVVEVILLGGPPQRQRTLRHVKKQHALRDMIVASNRSVSELEPLPRRLPPGSQRQGRPPQRDSQRSQSAPRPLSSSRARREIWNSGAIPVIVVPDRRSSHVSSKEPSLRSTSSRRSKRTMSLDSSTDDILRREPPLSGSHHRHSRRASDSTPRDERTIDFPPAIPPRSSSLSAPTSRNGSRTASMTADSIKARPEPEETAKVVEPKLLQSPQLTVQGESTRRPSNAQSITAREDGAAGLFLEPLEPLESPNSPMRFSSRNTPFSIASVDTTGTAPEVSEAFAVHMFPHQNSSLLMVNHSNKPSDASDATTERADDPLFSPPTIITSGPADELPVTPPGQHAVLVDADSPLRNPRAPPEPPTDPPAINLIPATPSRTPALDRGRQPASYFDHGNDRPARRPSLLRRAFSRRRHSIDQTPSQERPTGFLKRTFSLSRQVGRASVDIVRPRANDFDSEWAPTYSRAESEPSEQHKLHPFWRPQGDYEVCEYGPDCPHHRPRAGEPSGPRHGPNSRPPIVKRTLSSRMKQTFAILPTRPSELDEPYNMEPVPEPERRTIRRTNSGNLRVMKRKSSAESLGKAQNLHTPQQMPYQQAQRTSFWRTPSQRQSAPVENRRRFSISDRIEGLQQIPRKMSEKKREKRSDELRKMISAPTEVRDNVGEVIRYPHGPRTTF